MVVRVTPHPLTMGSQKEERVSPRPARPSSDTKQKCKKEKLCQFGEASFFWSVGELYSGGVLGWGPGPRCEHSHAWAKVTPQAGRLVKAGSPSPHGSYRGRKRPQGQAGGWRKRKPSDQAKLAPRWGTLPSPPPQAPCALLRVPWGAAL